MVVKNNNGKIKMKLTDDELILKFLVNDKKIKRKDIRSAFLTENSLVILTYNYRVINYPVSKEKFKFREQVKLLVDEINKEDIIFKSSYMGGSYYWFTIYPLLMIATINYERHIVLSIFIWLILLLTAVLLAIDGQRVTGIVYNIDTKIFTTVGYKNFNKDSFKIEDMEVAKINESGLVYRNKKSGYKFNIENIQDKIVYPVKNEQAVKEIETYFKQIDINN